MTHRLLLLACVLLLKVSFTFAQTTIVATRTAFNTAVQNASPGDTIALQNGVWSNTVLEFYAEGTQANPIVLTAETAGEVQLTGSSRLEIFFFFLLLYNLDFSNGALSGEAVVSFRKDSDELAENCRLTNCRISHYNPPTDDIAYKWVSIYGKNNRVDHCQFSGKNHEGALLVVWLNGQANYHQIDHNYFSDFPRLGRNGAETIRIGTSTRSMTESRTVVEYNLFEACDGELEIISNKSGFNVYRNNTFRNNDGVLTLRHGNDCEVYGNFFFGGLTKNSGGVRIIGERHKVYNNYFQDLRGSTTRAAISMMNGVPNSPLNRYFQVKDAEVVHNTMVSCNQPFAFGVGSNSELSLPPLDCIIANNVADKTTGSTPINYVDTPINIDYTSNYVYTNALSIVDPGLINADPMLSLSDGLWRPDSSSAIFNASTRLFSYVTSDMDGQSRMDTPELGSDEVSNLSITNSPLTTDDVGPDWADNATNLTDYHRISPTLFVKNSTLHIANLPEKHLPYTMSIYNVQGQQTQSHLLHQSEASVPVFNRKGVYIIKIIGKGNAYGTSKVVF
ncbi:MAG: chondroitinase-B domain-containing protein [Bacteroidia bacterium]